MKQETVHTLSEANAPEPSSLWKWLGRLFRLVVMVAIIAISTGIAYYWMTNQPKTERRPMRPVARLVETVPVEVGVERVTIRAMGSVVPATMIQIAARVNGQIVALGPNFEPGGRFALNETLLQIDERDYELIVRQQESSLERMQADVQLEMGQQTVARREFELLLEGVDEADAPLLLRQPQLAAKQAAVAAATAVLEKARLDLERTTIRSPFNAVVQSRNVDLGAYVSPGAPLATLVGTDVFWVEASIPVDELRWIFIPEPEGAPASEVRVFHEAAWGAAVHRRGVVERLVPNLEPQGRMARILIAVPNPLHLDDGEEAQYPLLLGSFVRVEIEGRELEGVTRIPRSALREGNRVWIMTPDNSLDIRLVTVVWGTTEMVLISEGVRDGDQLVVSDLAAPVAGMPLRTPESANDNQGRGARP